MEDYIVVKYQVDDILKTFTDAQKIRTGFMRRIAQTLTETTGNAFILKGGTALLLAYGLPRYSTDLDYDGRDRNIDIARYLQTSAERTGIQIDSLNLKKDTESVKRYMLHYKGSENDPLKVEISYRQAITINDKDITIIDGICVYVIEKLASLKAAAFLGRMKARDVFDIAFILRQYPDAIQKDLLIRISERVDELTLDLLSAAMREERILRGFDPDEIVLDLQNRIDRLKTKPSILNQMEEYKKDILNNHPKKKNSDKKFEPEL